MNLIRLYDLVACYSACYSLRPPIVDFLFPVTRPHCNFSAACNFIIAFGDHVIKIFIVAVHVVERLCGCIVGVTTSIMVHY